LGYLVFIHLFLMTAHRKRLLGKNYFKNLGQIKYEGPQSDNPLAFRWYDENKVVAGKTMKEHLRFSCAYWHLFCGSGADRFGEPTHLFPWSGIDNPIERACAKADTAFGFFANLGLAYYCFHDVDAVDYTNDVVENERRLQAITDYLKQKQNETGIKLLRGTANLFSNRRYMNGEATIPSFSCCSMQQRKGI
jgi:xylose isomerase